MTDPPAAENAGWVTAACAGVNTGLLVAARLVGAGAYGTAGLPFLLAHFVLCGALAAISANALLRAGPRVLTVPVAVAAATVGAIGSARAWAVTPAGRPLLPALLPWGGVPAVLWAITARRAQRPAALVTAAAMVGWWVVGVAFDH